MTDTAIPLTKARSELGEILHHLVRDPLGLVGLIIVTLIIASALFAPWLAPYDPVAMNIQDRLQGPSAAHLMGTDQIGRDTFSRVIWGGRVALQVALPTIGGAIAIGLVLGMMAGYGPKWLDSLIVLLFDTVRSFPTVMFALAVVALVGPSLNTVIVVIMLTSIPTYGRVVRTLTPVAERGRVHYRRTLARCEDAKDHGHSHPAQRPRPARRSRGDGHPDGRRAGSRPVLPRHGGQAADAVLGRASQ